MRETELQRRKRHKSKAGHREAASAMVQYHADYLPKRASESSKTYKRIEARRLRRLRPRAIKPLFSF